MDSICLLKAAFEMNVVFAHYEPQRSPGYWNWELLETVPARQNNFYELVCNNGGNLGLSLRILEWNFAIDCFENTQTINSNRNVALLEGIAKKQLHMFLSPRQDMMTKTTSRIASTLTVFARFSIQLPPVRGP